MAMQRTNKGWKWWPFGRKVNGDGWFAYSKVKMGPARLVFTFSPSSFPMDTQNPSQPSKNDTRPQDQQERAATAQPNAHDPAVNAASPNYGEFGGVPASGPTAANYAATNSAGRSGANDNPDEFSEFRDREKDAQNAPDRPEDQPGHVEQNQAPGLVAATQGEENDIQRQAWAIDDPRYAGGGTHNTREENADAKYPNNDDN
jgi:hypothetical protein